MVYRLGSEGKETARDGKPPVVTFLPFYTNLDEILVSWLGYQVATSKEKIIKNDCALVYRRMVSA